MKNFSQILNDPGAFSTALFGKMQCLNPALDDLEPYEFRYCLNNLIPDPGGWASVKLDSPEEIEKRVNDSSFYKGIQIKAKVGERIILDPHIVYLTNMLFVGLVTGEYPLEWVRAHFFFDVRGFFFLHRTTYFTEEVLAHLGGKPYRQFEQKQSAFERLQDVGYKALREANAEVDALFIESVKTLIASHGTPILLAIAGPTAAGKMEIVEFAAGLRAGR
jgi:hypothetical protein